MHWLMILGLLSATTDLKDPNASGSALNRLAENSIRQQLGNSVKNVRVDLKRGKGRAGDFDYFNVTLDGFDAAKLGDLQNRNSNNRNDSNRDSNRDEDYNNQDYNDRDYDDQFPELRLRSQSTPFARRTLPANSFNPGDIFNGDFGGIFNGDLGDILGGVLTGGVGRVGKMQINASNFSYDGVRYQGLNAGLGEIKFDWAKALRGDFDVKSVQPGNLGLSLRADQATRLIAPRLPSVRDVKLRFDDGRAYLGGRTDFYGVKVPFEAGGKLSVQTNQVRAEDLRLSISKLRLPSFVMDELTKSVNPLYDFDPNKKWPIAVNLNAANSGNDVLAMRGGLQWLGFKRNEKSNPKNKRDNRNEDYNDDGYNGDWKR